jgi:hypothetical protein
MTERFLIMILIPGVVGWTFGWFCGWIAALWSSDE